MTSQRPTIPSIGPWKPCVPLFDCQTAEEAEEWANWVCRPCGDCGHAFNDHDNNAFVLPPQEDCRFCSCIHFKEPQ